MQWGDQKDFFQPQGGHLIHLFLSPSPSITAWGCTIYRVYISCLFRYCTSSKPLQTESELEMNLRPKWRLSLPPPSPQTGSTVLPEGGSPGPQAPRRSQDPPCHPLKTTDTLVQPVGLVWEQCSRGQAEEKVWVRRRAGSAKTEQRLGSQAVMLR